jgi:hypothetical protein
MIKKSSGSTRAAESTGDNSYLLSADASVKRKNTSREDPKTVRFASTQTGAFLRAPKPMRFTCRLSAGFKAVHIASNQSDEYR